MPKYSLKKQNRIIIFRIELRNAKKSVSFLKRNQVAWHDPFKGTFCQDSFKNKSHLHAMIPYVNSKVKNVLLKLTSLRRDIFA